MARGVPRIRLGKFHNRLIDCGGLMSNGTDEYDLDWLLECFRNQLSLKKFNGTTRSLVTDVVAAVSAGYSTIVGVDWPGGEGHWLLVVGYQGQLIDGPEGCEKTNVTHLRCLDPLLEAPGCHCGMLFWRSRRPREPVVNAGRFPSNHWGGREPT